MRLFAGDGFVLASAAIVVIDVHVAVFLSLDLPFISKHHATRAVNQTTKRPRFFDSFLWFTSPLQRILHIVKKPFRNDGRMLAFVYLTQCITGLSNVREVTFLYRGINRLTP